MSRSIFQPEWRTQNRRKRRFYARYMGWLEKTGFVVVGLLVAAFASSFFYSVDEWVTAEDVAFELSDDGETLFVSPKLGGKSIANARTGQPAVLSNIRIQAPGDTLLRANLLGAAEGQAISRRLAGDAVRLALQESLLNRSVRSREDVPLRITEIGDVEVEATLQTSPSPEDGLAFDPNIELQLAGVVLEGKHVLSAQLGDLPPDVRRTAAGALEKSLLGRTVVVDGKSQKVQAVLDPRFVVRLRAENIGDSSDVLNAASLKRTFDAKVRLENVPLAVFERIAQAHREGKSVTAKVQVRTGARPIAYFLLRRS